LISAAEAGDFSEWTSDDGVRASIVIQGSDQPVPNETILSPLANHLAGYGVTDEAQAYELVLPEVERVITRTNDYEPLWRTAWQRMEMAARSFEGGGSKVETSANLSVITLAPEAFGAAGFDPSAHTVPLTAISRYARGQQLFLIAIPARPRRGWFYRIDYPYYSWAETVVRPRIARRDFSAVLAELNELEGGAGGWRSDTSELASAIKFLDESGALAPSKLTPERVAQTLRLALTDTGERVTGTASHG
jgi:hypothetical protein